MKIDSNDKIDVLHNIISGAAPTHFSAGKIFHFGNAETSLAARRISYLQRKYFIATASMTLLWGSYVSVAD